MPPRTSLRGVVGGGEGPTSEQIRGMPSLMPWPCGVPTWASIRFPGMRYFWISTRPRKACAECAMIAMNDCHESSGPEREPGSTKPTVTVHAVEPLFTNLPLLRNLQARANAGDAMSMFVHPMESP